MRRFCLGTIIATIIVPTAFAQAVPITADSVVNYAPGTPATSWNNSSAALGTLTGDTTFGGLTPFNPPFDPSQIVIVSAGGNLTLHLSAPVATTGQTLGVFVNNGLVDVSADGSGQASNPAITFSDFPQAIVSVSCPAAPTLYPAQRRQPDHLHQPIKLLS